MAESESEAGREFRRRQRDAAALHVAKLERELAEEKRRAAVRAKIKKRRGS